MRVGRFSRRREACLALFLITLVAILIFIFFFKGNGNIFPSLIYSRGIQRHPDCACKISAKLLSKERIVSSCSDELSQFTPNQKIISYSFYLPPKAEDSTYFLKLIPVNLEEMRKLYPGYTLRLYTDIVPNATQCSFMCENKDFQWCDIQKTPNYGDMAHAHPMTWRFLPLGDRNVNIFHVRDLDSIITEREAAAVRDWLENTNKSIHVMRDNEYHVTAILGGMWGSSNARLWKSVGYDTVENLRWKMMKAGWDSRDKGVDQGILTDTVYRHSEEIVAHDSYHCQTYTATMIRPFPVQRKDHSSDFVGNPGQGKYDLSKCPKACRPSYGENWEYC